MPDDGSHSTFNPNCVPAQPELRDWIKIDRRLPRDILNVFYSEKSEVMQHGMQDEGDFDARKIFDHFRK